MRRLRRLDRRWIDRAIAGVLLVAGVIELFARTGTPGPQSIAIVVVGYSTLLWRRSRKICAGQTPGSSWTKLRSPCQRNRASVSRSCIW